MAVAGAQKRIYFNRSPVRGPWGGGNKVLSALCQYFFDKGWDVTFDLQKDVDVLFCFDPRPNSHGIDCSVLYDYRSAHDGAIIVQRVGDVGSHSKPDLHALVQKTVECSDGIVFTSAWAKSQIAPRNPCWTIIQNAPLPEFYNHRRATTQLDADVLKLVTHHWSTNPFKGFDVYAALGRMIQEGRLEGVELTYIGRYPSNCPSEGMTLIAPQRMEELAVALPDFDAYLTASLYEAGANHVLEGMAAGLPVIHRKDGGSINEYCSGFGVEYGHSMDSLLAIIRQVKHNYASYKELAMTYDRSMKDTVGQYYDYVASVLCEKNVPRDGIGIANE